MQPKEERIPPEYFQIAREGIFRLMANIKSVITIKTQKLEYILAAKIAGGHVILADSHGVGKTSLAKALAGSIRWNHTSINRQGIPIESFSRIQCTVDLLPQDILGFNQFDIKNNQYRFNKGPIFAHFILTDEINLLTPKTQGSFFQVMEEQTVTIEGTTYEIPDPFFIIATMNLKGAHLFPLPAPQLDRFMIRISMGYPEENEESSIIEKHGKENSWDGFGPVIEDKELLAWQKLVDHVSLSREVIDYITRIIRKTRHHPGVITGASPRAGIKLSRASRALALIRGMDYVSIDIVKEMAVPVLAHRLELEDPAMDANEIITQVLKEVPTKV
ncbi:MAG: MoxR family ATPase [Leptospiraceae bacterium]|nr:MoxR family ATPase [Leptospiraceae bacterium]MDW7975686.1 MoxR family ATPase [Leptospiraceae bacterium]